MKNIVSKVQFRVVFLLLFTAVMLTFPFVTTKSKYVWEDTITVDLKISCNGQGLTSGGTAGYLSESWAFELVHVRAESVEAGVILTADEGYMLPECITVKIGEANFSVRTDGTEAPEGISYDPADGLLSILESLIDEYPGGVTISAAAVSEDVQGE